MKDKSGHSHYRPLLSCAVACILGCGIMNSMPVQADTVNDLLAVYGHAKSVDTTQLKADVAKAKDALEAQEDLKKSLTLKLTGYALAKDNLVEILESYDKDIYLLQDDLKLLEERMLNSKLDDINKLLALDAAYEDTERELYAKMEERSMITDSLESYLQTNAQVDTNVDEVTQEITSTKADLEQKQSLLAEALGATEIGEVKEVKHPLKNDYFVTSPFGPRLNPISRSGTEYHKGIDLRASLNDVVMAAFNGTIEDCGYNDTMGNYVWINHGEGIRTVYMHMNKLADIHVGDKVKQYSTIGFAGTTGSSTGVHLHFGIYLNGKAVNPALLWR